jgi:TPR repeat protein
MYTNGRGVKRDDALASYMFRLAARQGNEHAQKMLRFVGEPMPGVPECLRDKQPEKQTFPQQTALRAPENAVNFVPLTETQRKAVELVNKLAPEYGVNPRLALAVIRAESNFDPLARSEKNAQGLMQLIPERRRSSTYRNLSIPYRMSAEAWRISAGCLRIFRETSP